MMAPPFESSRRFVDGRLFFDFGDDFRGALFFDKTSGSAWRSSFAAQN